jgi:hypothetical protein
MLQIPVTGFVSAFPSIVAARNFSLYPILLISLPVVLLSGPDTASLETRYEFSQYPITSSSMTRYSLISRTDRVFSQDPISIAASDAFGLLSRPDIPIRAFILGFEISRHLPRRPPNDPYLKNQYPKPASRISGVGPRRDETWEAGVLDFSQGPIGRRLET